MALCSIQDIETYTNSTITGGSDEDKYDYLILSVSALIESICDRKFNSASYEEDYDIDGNRINLNQYPVISITSVSYGSPFGGEDRTLFETDEYTTINDSGILSLQFGFNRAQQYVSVSYTAGYVNIPADLVQITVEEVIRQFKLSKLDTNKESEKLDNYSYKLSKTTETMSSLTDSLSKYIKCVGI